ncbi:GWxTD domain-containing protein [Ekhidna sp.]
MFKHRFLFGLIIVLLGFSANAINFTRVNIAWQYDPNADLKLSHRVVRVEEGIYVFMQIAADSINDWQYEFLAQSGYESEDHKLIEATRIDTLKEVTGEIMIKISLEFLEEKLLVVKISQLEKFYYYDINLAVGNLSFPSIYPLDSDGLPILTNYINRSEFSWKGNSTFLARQYQESFPPADPPMADMSLLAPQIDVDTSFIFGDSVNFLENHFYVVQKDSLSTVGVTMLKVPPYFPEYRQLGELVESMLYLTSEQERKSMLKSRNLKQSFDSFWMNTYSTKSRARNAIRKYYDLIENANNMFTDFKPGWKTDRGMMYITFGLPDEVYRSANAEEWYYDDGKAFEFTVISTFFASRTYSLRRSKDLEEQWYTQIATMRRGVNE